MFDSTVFDTSHLVKFPGYFFRIGEFLMADAGYAAKYFICTPFRQPAANIPHNKLFNELFSSARCKIEHVNGMLKGRFQSLKGLRTQIKEKEDLEKVNKWILVCLILHNKWIFFFRPSSSP